MNVSGSCLANGEFFERCRFVHEDLTNFLFANLNFPGSDLVARNIQRGRDHGLPGYNDWREFCGLPRACSWDQPPEEMDWFAWEALQRTYDDTSDIDLFTAGIMELPFGGGVVGRTFNCIIGRQFAAMKFGDRFFFTHEGDEIANPFTVDQLKNIRKRNLGDIICDNTKLRTVKENVFLSFSPQLECGNHHKLDLELFKECDGHDEEH